MNSFSQMGEWIRKKRKKPNKTDFLVMILLGVLVMIIAIPSPTEWKRPSSGLNSGITGL